METNNDKASISIAKNYNALFTNSGGHDNPHLKGLFPAAVEYNKEFYSSTKRDDEVQNASTNLGKLSKWKEIEGALHNVVHDTLDQEEFDAVWGLMVETFGIHDNTWLKETYEIRERWAPAYWRSMFWAGMSSTQRSEGQCEVALKGKVEEEKLLSFNSTYKPHIYNKDMIAQYVFQKACTNAKFLEVKAECDFFKLISEFKTTSLGGAKGDLSYSCKLFEFEVILCRHTTKIIEFEDVNVILEKCIVSG
ncbi:Protein FAR1-RELATED SEQUENCE 6 [Bienertia sinuspersici]